LAYRSSAHRLASPSKSSSMARACA
jgi:hypothetical protein